MASIKNQSPARKRVFDDTPKFTKNERIGFITLDQQTRKIVGSLKSNDNKVGFVLQRAYFQAKGRFFVPDKYRAVDKRLAEKMLGIKKPCDLSQYNAKTASYHRKRILELYQWKPYSDKERSALTVHALLQVDKRQPAEDILFSLLAYCWKEKIETPGYNEFAAIVSKSLNEYETIMLKRVEENITAKQKDVILALINNPDVVTRFSELTRIDQSETQKKLNQNAKILELFKQTFLTIKPLLDSLALTPDAVKHFSGTIYNSTLPQIKQTKNTHLICLQLSAFVEDQFFLRQDYAIDAFLKRIKAVVNTARKKDSLLREKEEETLMEANRSVLDSAKTAKQILKLIAEISQNESYSLSERNQKVIHLVESFFEAEDPDTLAHSQRIETTLNNSRLKFNFLNCLFEHSDSLQKSLSPLIKVLLFDESNSTPELIEAIKYFSKNMTQLEDHTPVAFLSDNEKNVLFSDHVIPAVSRYKMLLFTHIHQAIRNRHLTLEYSYRYRAYRRYMISDVQWKKDKLDLIAAAQLSQYIDGKQVLNQHGGQLTDTYTRINKNYLDNKNAFLTVNTKGEWKIKSSEAEYDSSKYIPKLLSDSKSKLLYELLAEIDKYTDFSDVFSHHSTKNANKSIDKKLIYAALMSLGTNLGHRDLSRSTKDISEKQLRDTEKLWLSNENISKANQCIISFIQSLPLPTIFNDQEGFIHSSSDGKKVVVAVNSLLANYSFKYYGKEQGVSVNNFLDEKQSFFHVNVLTSSDREAPYMMDGLVKTKTNIFREGEFQHRHSTDTHGYTEAIFAGLHFLDVSFAPRIAKVNKQTLYAYEAKSTRKKSKNPIAPKTVINKKLILDNWDDILRLMTTIKLGHCSASLLFRILSSSKQENDLYRAIKEFGRLIKSKFILDYIDDESLRKKIQKQLNRVELGQKLSEAVFFGRAGRLHVGEPDEMQKAMECKTFLKNVIILWNYLFLSDYYLKLGSKAEKEFLLETIRTGSVISWEHLNMKGIYDFSQKINHSFSASISDMMKIKMAV